MDPNEPQWRINSSYSPPPSRRWDCRFRSDGFPTASYGDGVPRYRSSLPSNKGSRNMVSSGQYPNHHHSASDGALSYLGSPSDNFQVPRWTPPVHKYDFGEFTTPVRGARPETSSYPQSIERCFATEVSSVSNSFGSTSPFSESGQWGSTSKQPMFCPQRNASGRRSFMSKPVYPLVFRNPVSDSESFELPNMSSGGRLTTVENGMSSVWTDRSSSRELKFQRTIAEMQKVEGSPDPSTSSRREGFRWSNASSYDFGLDGGSSIDITEHVDSETQMRHDNPNLDQQCGLCRRLLWQKSPWSSYRIIKSHDMPITGVLPCGHIFHADCLDQTTPKTQIHDPPCPLCSKVADGDEETIPFSEPLRVALRSVRRNQGINIASGGDVGNLSNRSLNGLESSFRRNCSSRAPLRGGNFFMKNRFKKRFSFKGKMGKELFSTKVFSRGGSSSSSLPIHENQISTLEISRS
ncbi:hypothetical protein QJS04_geneDACA015156 [Acorus gramineus]|uniref:RING-type domain-containing protein n=1 Tax=Acorus gramineus TaxID=55184 RepID=A0AAV9BWX2_ACOGR|nr:hypothetical protein QJS04_geneDACA015156 [Acorus gramineus]